jgi:methionyl aminopeptidase
MSSRSSAPPAPPTINAREAQSARAAAQKVVQTHRRLADWLHPGVTLAEIDRFIARTLEDLACRSCFLGYRIPRSPAFPSHACLSVNECIVHGTAGYYTPPLKGGDILKVDIGVFFEGWIGDAAWTYVFGDPSPEIRRLTQCGKEALRRGIQQLQPGRLYLEWARAVQTHVEEECGYHLIRGLGGHGYGRRLHAPPFISNTLPVHGNDWPEGYLPAAPGTLIAVEPMIAIGTGQTTQKRNQWPVFTADGSLSVHYEHDILITESGPEVLTEGLEELKDVIV